MDMQAETFAFLFHKLKILYNFNPKILTCDFDLSLRKAIKKIYPDIKFFGCYYHFIRAIRKNLLKYYIPKIMIILNFLIVLQILEYYHLS